MSARRLAPTVEEQSQEITVSSALQDSSTSMEIVKQGPPNADSISTGAEPNVSAVLDTSW